MTLSSSLSKDQCQKKWEGLLGQNYDTVGGDPTHPNSGIECSSTASGSEVRMTLASDDEYTLRISKIGFGDTSALSDAADAKEVVPTETEKVTAPGTATLDATVGEGKSFTVLVRDKYGNPVSGAAVSTDNPGTDVESGTVAESSKTGDNGKAEFTYTPESDAGETKTIVISSPDASFEATYEFDITNDNNDLLGSGDITNGYIFNVIVEEASLKEIKLKNRNDDRSVTAEAVRISGAFDDPGGSDTDPDTVFINDQEITFNGGMTQLNEDIPIAPSEIGVMNLGEEGSSTKGGFWIMSVKYSVEGQSEPTTVTYAISLKDSSSGGSGNNGQGNH